MKTLAAILLAAGLGADSLPAREAAGAPGAEPAPAAPPTAPAADPGRVSPAVAEALKKHSKEEQQRFSALLNEASKLLQSNEPQGALDRIGEAEKIEPDFFALHNLKGAAFSRKRDFEKATAAFERCLALNPASDDAKFNLAEMKFVSKKYKEALADFDGILTANDKVTPKSRSLLLYKKYLCLLLADRAAEADILLKTFRFEADTPEYYFANAAKSFRAGDNEKAHGWLRSAGNIYRPELRSLYLDSLVEIGWLKGQ